MPILDVQIIGEISRSGNSVLARELADAAGEVFDSPPHGTWVKLEFVDEANYSESGGVENGLPVIVKLTLAHPPQNSILAGLLSELTTRFANIIGRNRNNVHIIVEPPAAGRIAFGGEIKQ